jgi:hypothetical protein
MKADSLLKSIGLRSIELNNKLIQTEKEFKMKFYLSPFHGGLIIVKESFTHLEHIRASAQQQLFGLFRM